MLSTFEVPTTKKLRTYEIVDILNLKNLMFSLTAGLEPIDINNNDNMGIHKHILRPAVEIIHLLKVVPATHKLYKAITLLIFLIWLQSHWDGHAQYICITKSKAT